MSPEKTLATASYSLTSPSSQGTLANIISPTAARTRKQRPDILLGPYIKDFLSGFFREKMSNSRDRTFCLGISTFFRGVPPRVGAAQRQKKMAFWLAFALFSTKLSAVFSGGTAGSSCPQCTHTRTHIHARAARRSPVAATAAAGAHLRRWALRKCAKDQHCKQW